MTCPNCDADMILDEDTGIYECPECGYIDNCHNI